MNSLLAALRDHDQGMLPALAEVWGVDSKSLQQDDLLRELQRNMLDSAKAEATWDKLDEAARGALQMLASSEQARVRLSQFERVNGEIRKMGKAQISREQPHKAPRTVAEALYYRGLISQAYDDVDGNLLRFVYVPSDLLQVLPLHKTSFDALGELGASADTPLSGLETIAKLAEFTRADTTIVDDMTTLLAQLQVQAQSLAGSRFSPQQRDALLPQLLHKDEARLGFLLALGLSSGLLEVEADKAQPSRNAARTWLQASRSQQLRQLAEAWRASRHYRELWQVPGLHPEDSGWSYDAVAARGAMLELFGDLLPEQGWVSLGDVIELIKENDPDFQRLDGDYDRWYIRNDAGEYLSGFSSWDAIEGALLEFSVAGPMHWLGLVDIGEDALRLTAYGRAFLQLCDWPQPQEMREPISIHPDGQLQVSRRVSRFERFQLARFASCSSASAPYIYRIDEHSRQLAATQGISTQQIHSFLSRQLQGKPLPLPLVRQLRSWQQGSRASVSIERQVILRCGAEDTLDKLYAKPELRRFLGARLGPRACVLRAEHWQGLQAALAELAMDVDSSRMGADEGA